MSGQLEEAHRAVVLLHLFSNGGSYRERLSTWIVSRDQNLSAASSGDELASVSACTRQEPVDSSRYANVFFCIVRYAMLTFFSRVQAPNL